MPKDTREIVRDIRHTTSTGKSITFKPGDEDELEEELDALAEEDGGESKEDALKRLTISGAITGFGVDVTDEDLEANSKAADIRARANATRPMTESDEEGPKRSSAKRAGGRKRASKRATASSEE